MSLAATFVSKIKFFLEKPTNQGRLFIMLGILALGFGAWRIVNTIRSPFVQDTKNTVATEQVQASVQDEIQNLSELRAKDTDLDGLSDYDELYVYGTSPYVEDTDSDGYSDKTEIDTGNNPTCKAGEKCLLSTVDTTGNTSETDNLVAPTDPYAMTATEIRELLLQSGIDEATLEQIDDDTLRQMFQQAYSEAEETAGTDVSSGDIDANSTTENEYTPAELRKLLIEGGVAKEQVDAVTDEELLQLYQEIISTNN
jgi:hypothetical protein